MRKYSMSSKARRCATRPAEFRRQPIRRASPFLTAVLDIKAVSPLRHTFGRSANDRRGDQSFSSISSRRRSHYWEKAGAPGSSSATQTKQHGHPTSTTLSENVQTASEQSDPTVADAPPEPATLSMTPSPLKQTYFQSLTDSSATSLATNPAGNILQPTPATPVNEATQHTRNLQNP